MDTQPCLIVYTVGIRNAVGTHTGVYSTRTIVPVVRAPLGVLARRAWWASFGIDGAQGGIRTPTPLPALDPESSASASSATWAQCAVKRSKIILPAAPGNVNAPRLRRTRGVGVSGSDELNRLKPVIHSGENLGGDKPAFQCGRIAGPAVPHHQYAPISRTR